MWVKYDMIEIIASVVAVLISTMTFVLTRWENRKQLTIEMFMGDSYRFTNISYIVNDEEESQEIVFIRINNTGAKPVVVDFNSIKISGNGHFLSSAEPGDNWIGLSNIPAPSLPGTSFEIGIPQKCFEECLGVAEFQNYMNVTDFEKCIISIFVEVRDYSGKLYMNSKAYYYNFYVGEFWPQSRIRLE